MIPWRVKNMISQRFPLLYHVIANRGTRGNDVAHWDLRLAESWDSPGWDWPTRNELVASACSHDDAVLDVGCGTGTTLRYLRQKGHHKLTGLDISGYAVDRLNADGIHARRGSGVALPFDDASFDVVVAAEVLEHIVRRGRFAREIRRVLRPGGRAFLFVPDDCLGPLEEPEHAYRYTRESLARFLYRYFSTVDTRTIRDVNHRMPILFACARTTWQ